ncbi:MAG: hypothetical protein ACI4F8_09595 [Lachnospiraceae bacterium]
MKKGVKKRIHNLVQKRWILLALMSIFVLQCLILGVQSYHPDCETYLLKLKGLSPLYPTFLEINRVIFGGTFLTMVGVEQNILLAVSIYIMYCSLKKNLQVGGTFLSCAIMFILIVPHLVTPVITRSHLILSNSILTEGLSFPLFNLYVAMLLTCCVEKSRKFFWISGILCAIMLPLRTQFLYLLVVQGCAFLYLAFTVRKKEWIANMLVFPVSILMMLLVSGIYTRWVATPGTNYSYGTNQVLAIRAMYYAEEEDVDLLSSEEAKTVFRKSLTQMQEQKLGYRFEGTGIFNRTAHEEDSYDTIKFIVSDSIYEILISKMERYSHEFIEYGKKIYAELCGPLLKHTWKQQLTYYTDFVLQGFIRSISIWDRELLWFGIGMYILYLIAFIRQIVIKKNRPLILLFSIVTLLLTGNVLTTSFAIMCLSRYMIYNMSLFYIVLLLGLLELRRIPRSV